MGQAISWFAITLTYIFFMQWRLEALGSMPVFFARSIQIAVEGGVLSSLLVWIFCSAERGRLQEAIKSFQAESKLSKMDTFVCIIDTLRRFRYRARAFRIEQDEPYSGRIIASINFADYCHRELATMVPHGRIEYNITVFITVSTNKKTGGAKIACKWTVDVDPPISTDEASLVCMAVKNQMLEKIADLEFVSEERKRRHENSNSDFDDDLDEDMFEENWLECAKNEEQSGDEAVAGNRKRY